MGGTVRRTISLPADVAKRVDEIAEAEGKTVSAVVQDALQLARTVQLKQQYRGIQGYWTSKAREKGILTEKDLKGYLGD